MMKFFTVAEAAQILRVTEKSVRDFILAGELRASKIGQWKIQEDDLVAFIKARQNSEAERFLRERKPEAPGTLKGYLVLDYYTRDPAGIVKRMTDYINNAGLTAITWNYEYDETISRARFTASGEPRFLKALLDAILVDKPYAD
jgi:excisionase family DNA binding protein